LKLYAQAPIIHIHSVTPARTPPHLFDFIYSNQTLYTTTLYNTLMARGTTKKIAAAVNKPGRKAATASASALQEQREEARQTLLKAKATRSQYTGHLE
jgi:hypothetical protein